MYAPIDPAASIYRVLSSKLEVTLKKTATDKWPTLESTTTGTATTTTTTTGSDGLRQPERRGAPMYPTSSKSGPKNWDSLVAADESKEGGGDGGNKDGDAALTDLFQTLYKDADEDTKRAMIKSYTESGGTSLSTDWSSVKKGKVEVKPPEGMEARKYER